MYTEQTNHCDASQARRRNISLSEISALFPETALQTPTAFSADLTPTTEQYIRIIKTLWQTASIYRETLRHTYFTDDAVQERLDAIFPIFLHLRDEFARDMGISIAENLCELGNEL